MYNHIQLRDESQKRIDTILEKTQKDIFGVLLAELKEGHLGPDVLSRIRSENNDSTVGTEYGPAFLIPNEIFFQEAIRLASWLHKESERHQNQFKNIAESYDSQDLDYFTDLIEKEGR